MKKITFIWMFSLCMTWVLNPVFAIEYGTDFLEFGNPGGWSGSLKTFDEGVTVGLGDTFAIDIWGADIPEAIISSGFQLTYDPAQVSIVSVEAYDGIDIAGGPWDGSGTFKYPDTPAPGSYIVGVVQLGCLTPDAGADIIIAKATFQCLSAGTTPITIKAIPDFDTTVGCEGGNIYDSQMGTTTILISQGTSLTTSSSSTSTIPPVTTTTSIIPECAMDSDCPDDGLYCNGEEFCDEAGAVCMSTGNPCAAGLVCDEDADECKPTASPLTLQLTPEAWYQSLWVPLIKFLRIEGSGTHFARSVTKITIAPASAAIVLPLVIDETTINCVGILLPGWLAPVDAIDVTVTTGEEEATASMEIKLLPFLLEQKGNALWGERF